MKKPPKSNPWWKFSHFDMVLAKPEVRSPHRKRISEASFRRTTCQFYFWHRNTSSVFSVDEIRSSFGAFLKMSTCLRLFLEVQQCQLEPIFGFWGHEVWRIGLQLHSAPRFKKSMSPNLEKIKHTATLWKFWDFLFTQILREINFGQTRSFACPGALKFVNLVNFSLQKCKNS